jgi:hypothetical protein
VQKKPDCGWAEANFKKKERQTQEGEKAWANHVAAGNAADVYRAKLKAQRLARDAAEQAPKTASKAKKHMLLSSVAFWRRTNQ